MKRTPSRVTVPASLPSLVSSVALGALCLVGCTAKVSPDAPETASSGGNGTGGAGASGGASGSGGSKATTGGAGGAGGSGTGGASTGGSTSGGSGGSGGSGTGGSGGSGGLVDPPEEQCALETGDAIRVGRTRLRRLTRSQFEHTVRDLLGATGTPAQGISPDETVGPFTSNAVSPITELLVQQHLEAAQALAVAAKARMAQISPCDLATGETCVRRFVADFGLKAYRRPLEPAEVDAYVTLFGVGGSDVSNGFSLVLEAMLQSPYFLYHADIGDTGVPTATPQPLTPYELASRLSYFLWDTMPDQALFDLAAAGTLDDDATLTAEVSRLLADDKANDSVPSFHLQWLDIDANQFGTLGQTEPEVATAMLNETSRFSDHVVREGDGLLATLLTASYSFPEGPLFATYGVTQPAGFVPGMRVELDPTERGGLLTQAGFLVKHYRGELPSPVHRGITVRENILCQSIDPPPVDVMASPLPPSLGPTARDRFVAHETDPTCGGCHTQMDPIGLALENYDGIGAWRTEEGGEPIDASGIVYDAGPDLEVPFTGGVELGQRLAASRAVRDCVSNQWFRYSLGRMESVDDGCGLRSIHERFAATGNVRELITDIVLSNAFRRVRAIGN
jgi:hypothetical protein